MKNILLVEDNDDDAFIMKRACSRAGIPHTLHVVGDGQAALDYLSGANAYSNRREYPLPDLLFLDLQLPKKTGLEVLEWLRSQPGFKNLPVVILTSSTLSSDVERAYTLGTTSYLKKISGMAEFGQAVRVILKFWLELNILPS